jgi:hypothetical protein
MWKLHPALAWRIEGQRLRISIADIAISPRPV